MTIVKDVIITSNNGLLSSKDTDFKRKAQVFNGSCFCLQVLLGWCLELGAMKKMIG